MESSSELIAIFSNHSGLERGLVVLQKQLRPLIWGRELEDSHLYAIKTYLDAFPRADHFFTAFESVYESTSNTAILLIDCIRLIICYHITYHRPCSGIIMSILPGIQKSIFRQLHTLHPNLCAHVLALLATICKTGRSGCQIVGDHFDFSMKPFERFPLLFKPIGNEDHSVWSVRQCFIDFILSYVQYSHGIFREPFVSSTIGKRLIGAIFKNFHRDHIVQQKRILSVFYDVAVTESMNSFSTAVSVYHAHNILAIVRLSDRYEDKSYLKKYLEQICSIPGQGVCFAVKSADNEQLPVKNRILLDLLPMLKPLESEFEQDLAVSILTAAPDCLSGYLSKTKFNYELDQSARWNALMAFMSRILKAEFPGFIGVRALRDVCLCEYMPPRTIVFKALENHEKIVNQVYMVTLLKEFAIKVFSNLSKIEQSMTLQSMESQSIPRDADSSDFLKSVRDDLIAAFLKACPDDQVVFSLFEDYIEYYQQHQDELNTVIMTRFIEFMSIFIIFAPKDRLTIRKLLEVSKAVQVKSVKEALIKLAANVKSDLPKDLLCDESVSVKEILKSFILRRRLVNDHRKAEAAAHWADANRELFFESIDKVDRNEEEPLECLAKIQFGISEDKGWVRPQVHAPLKRKARVEVDELSARGIFTAIGKEGLFRLLKEFDPQEAHMDAISSLDQLLSCSNITPWLQLIAHGVMDKAFVADSKFCCEQLPILFISLSSQDDLIRKAGYSLLDRVYWSLQNDFLFKERYQLKLLFDVFIGTLKYQKSDADQRQPIARAYFCAQAAPILCQPLHPLYKAINNGLLKKFCFPQAGLPLFDQLHESIGPSLPPIHPMTFLLRLHDNVKGKGKGGLTEWQVARLGILATAMPTKLARLA